MFPTIPQHSGRVLRLVQSHNIQGVYYVSYNPTTYRVCITSRTIPQHTGCVLRLVQSHNIQGVYYVSYNPTTYRVCITSPTIPQHTGYVLRLLQSHYISITSLTTAHLHSTSILYSKKIPQSSGRLLHCKYQLKWRGWISLDHFWLACGQMTRLILQNKLMLTIWPFVGDDVKAPIQLTHCHCLRVDDPEFNLQNQW